VTEDVRWKQRFANFLNAFGELKEGVELGDAKPLSKLERQGVIQGFEYTHELAWNVLKDYLEFQGIVGLIGSRDTTREAFKRALIPDGEVWMEMIKSRNLISHGYDQATAEKIYAAIRSEYFPAFQKLYTEFARRLTQDD